MKELDMRPEFRKYRKLNVPFNKVFLHMVNTAMPIIQKSNSSYSDKLTIEKVDFKEFSAEFIYPKGKNNLPCLVYYHGGGFILKASRMHRNIVREYAYRANIAVLFVDYRLALDYKFPIPFEDCYQAYCWAENRFPNQTIYVGGDSAGGNLALGITRKAMNENNKKPSKLFLVYPVVDPRMKTDSMTQYVDTPLWNAKQNDKMWKLYLNGADANDARVMFTEEDDYRHFPECYIETAEFDCLRDEGIMLAEAIRKSNVPVTEVNTVGTIHGYDIEEKSDYVRSIVEKRIMFLRS